MRRFLGIALAALLAVVIPLSAGHAIEPNGKKIILLNGQARPVLDLNFISGNNTLDPRVAFSRPSNATEYNSAGLLVTVGSGVPRFDYNPSTLALNGLLIEEARTNTITQSGFASGWSVAASAVLTANNAAGPDGGATSASTLAFAASSTSAIFQSQSFTSGTTYTLSLWMRVPSGIATARFDLFDGASDHIDTDKTITTTWTRFSFSVASANTGSGNFQLRNGSAGSAQTIQIFGAQLEAGSFPTSYIPTTTASVTRAADVATVAVSAFAYNQAAGTIIAEWTDLPGTSGNQYVVSLDNNTFINRIDIVSSGISGGATAEVVAGNVVQYTTGLFPQISPIPSRAAVAYSAASMRAASAGALGGAAVSGTVPPATALGLGFLHSQNNGFLNGWLRRVQDFNQRLPDPRLQQKTSSLFPANDNALRAVA
jgi:hypothetical protein